ncbi:MAG: hypothetical protein ACXVCY_19350 [Pseudobdellovibrionaceae bacterium]
MLFRILFLLTYTFSALAEDINPSSIQGLNIPAEVLSSSCKTSNGCSGEAHKIIEQVKLTCEFQTQGAECDKLARQHPDWAPLFRHCDTDTLCKQNEDYIKEQGEACLRGFRNAAEDLGMTVSELTLSLGKYVEQSWEKYKNNVLYKEEFIKECDKSLACKRDLVKEDPGYQNLTDEKLNQLPTAFLLKRTERVRTTLDHQKSKKSGQSLLVIQPNGELALNVEQIEKLKQLLATATAKIKEEYNRYQCYSPLAQQELSCYQVGSLVDPTMLAGYFIKGTRIALAIGKERLIARATEKTGVSAKEIIRKGDQSKAVDSSQSSAVGRNVKNSRAEFVNKYLEYSPTTVAQNERWISLAEQGVKSRYHFFDFENSQIKVLNDKLKEKNLVTSLTNYQKDILDQKIQALKKEFPKMQMEVYSDFKSMRYAFNEAAPKDIESRMQKIYEETLQEYENYLKEQGIVRKEDNVRDWFRAGVGQTADQANLAARYSRQQSENKVQNFIDAKDALNSKLKSIENDRQALRNGFGGTSVIDGNTLHVDAFDIVRKAQGDTKKISSELAHRFGLSHIPEKSIETLKRYVKEADEFSPGLYIAKRENAHLNDAVNGGLSADIIGLGGANLKGTAEALAKTTSVEKATLSTRRAEKEVTRNFVEQKKTFEEVVKRAVDPSKLKTVCSGDDCVSIATSPLTVAEKTKILGELSKTKYAGSYRIAFISDGIKEAESRNILATHGEGIEKILRKSLSSKIEPNKLKGLTFGMDMRTQVLNSGGVKLLVGEADGVILSDTERSLIRKRFQEAVETLNKDLTEQGEEIVRYSPLP